MTHATDRTTQPTGRRRESVVRGGEGVVTEGDAPSTARRTTQSLDERYGRGPRGGPTRTRRTRLLFAGGAAAVLLLAVGWGAWVSHNVTDKPVTWQDVGYEVARDDLTRVTFDVRFARDVPADGEAVCTLRALSESMAEVGLTDVTVGPASRRDLRVKAEIPTSERAVTGLVKECAVRGR
jgi:uncharacterized protein DUF4307